MLCARMYRAGKKYRLGLYFGSGFLNFRHAADITYMRSSDPRGVWTWTMGPCDHVTMSLVWTVYCSV